MRRVAAKLRDGMGKSTATRSARCTVTISKKSRSVGVGTPGAAPVFERYFIAPEFTALPQFSKARFGKKQAILMGIDPGILIAEAVTG
jgi:hypothetical protein